MHAVQSGAAVSGAGRRTKHASHTQDKEHAPLQAAQKLACMRACVRAGHAGGRPGGLRSSRSAVKSSRMRVEAWNASASVMSMSDQSSPKSVRALRVGGRAVVRRRRHTWAWARRPFAVRSTSHHQHM